MIQYKMDVPERNVLRRATDNVGALVGSCPTACAFVSVLVNEEIKRVTANGAVPDVMRIVFQALETVHLGSHKYRIISDCAIDPVKYCTNNYSDMLNVLKVLQDENPGVEYLTLTWDVKTNSYVPA